MKLAVVIRKRPNDPYREFCWLQQMDYLLGRILIVDRYNYDDSYYTHGQWVLDTEWCEIIPWCADV
jgi:hypothetical protein